MLAERVGSFLSGQRDRLVHRLTRAGADPNLLTGIGFLATVAAAFALSRGYFLAAGGILIAAGMFDVLDGSVARATGRVTSFGAFLDSVVDRYSDAILFLGLLFYYLLREAHVYVVLVFVVCIGSFVTSYARARGENQVNPVGIGLLKRPERFMLLIFGCLTGRVEMVLWVMAGLAHFTVAQRVYFVWGRLRGSLPDGLGPGDGSEDGRQAIPRRWFLADFRRGSWQYYAYLGVVLAVVLLLDRLALP